MAPARRRQSKGRVGLQRHDFDLARAARQVRRGDCGAAVLYLGTVRSTPHGGGRRRVVRLAYEAFEPMALVKLAEVRRDAMARFRAKEMVLYHRLGTLRVGENVVLCAAAAPHREEALAAVRFAIAEMKQRVPIWKKEIYRGGGQKWVLGEMRPKEAVARDARKRR